MARGRDYPDSLGVEDLAGVSEAETLAGPVVHRPDAGLQLLGRDLGQLRAFGQLLAEYAIGVLVGGIRGHPYRIPVKYNNIFPCETLPCFRPYRDAVSRFDRPSPPSRA